MARCWTPTLTALGHVPQDVEALASTHLHTGWGYVRDADGKLAQTFPKSSLHGDARTQPRSHAASQRQLNDLETSGTIGFAFHFGDQLVV
ncbi:hypothetical protein N4G69_27325 [Streptomyces mirabilis]|uniref:hypothetical protein n=1 Tax=Streptomyces mirabilis TaxID=68239 RepID=UPI0021BE60D4|nr:hypothetical protein [Streptomyces mirabilis]MCT9109278.1 hypothetical protein [Streptomyces mirabilis]